MKWSKFNLLYSNSTDHEQPSSTLSKGKGKGKGKGNTAAAPASGSGTTRSSCESQTTQYPYGLTAEAYYAIRTAVAEELRNNPRSRVVSFAGGGGGEGGPCGSVLVSLYTSKHHGTKIDLALYVSLQNLSISKCKSIKIIQNRNIPDLPNRHTCTCGQQTF